MSLPNDVAANLVGSQLAARPSAAVAPVPPNHPKPVSQNERKEDNEILEIIQSQEGQRLVVPQNSLKVKNIIVKFLERKAGGLKKDLKTEYGKAAEEMVKTQVEYTAGLKTIHALIKDVKNQEDIEYILNRQGHANRLFGSKAHLSGAAIRQDMLKVLEDNFKASEAIEEVIQKNLFPGVPKAEFTRKNKDPKDNPKPVGDATQLKRGLDLVAKEIDKYSEVFQNGVALYHNITPEEKAAINDKLTPQPEVSSDPVLFAKAAKQTNPRFTDYFIKLVQIPTKYALLYKQELSSIFNAELDSELNNADGSSNPRAIQSKATYILEYLRKVGLAKVMPFADQGLDGAVAEQSLLDSSSQEMQTNFEKNVLKAIMAMDLNDMIEGSVSYEKAVELSTVINKVGKPKAEGKDDVEAEAIAELNKTKAKFTKALQLAERKALSAEIKVKVERSEKEAARQAVEHAQRLNLADNARRLAAEQQLAELQANHQREELTRQQAAELIARTEAEIKAGKDQGAAAAGQLPHLEHKEPASRVFGRTKSAKPPVVGVSFESLFGRPKYKAQPSAERAPLLADEIHAVSDDKHRVEERMIPEAEFAKLIQQTLKKEILASDRAAAAEQRAKEAVAESARLEKTVNDALTDRDALRVRMERLAERATAEDARYLEAIGLYETEIEGLKAEAKLQAELDQTQALRLQEDLRVALDNLAEERGEAERAALAVVEEKARLEGQNRNLAGRIDGLREELDRAQATVANANRDRNRALEKVRLIEAQLLALRDQARIATEAKDRAEADIQLVQGNLADAEAARDFAIDQREAERARADGLVVELAAAEMGRDAEHDRANGLGVERDRLVLERDREAAAVLVERAERVVAELGLAAEHDRANGLVPERDAAIAARDGAEAARLAALAARDAERNRAIRAEADLAAERARVPAAARTARPLTADQLSQDRRRRGRY